MMSGMSAEISVMYNTLQKRTAVSDGAHETMQLYCMVRVQVVGSRGGRGSYTS
jgi:hypothetical protein